MTGVAVGSRSVAIEEGVRHGFQPIILEVDGLLLFSMLRPVPSRRRLTIFIEGDGAPWPSLGVPPGDPTPKRSIALELALRTPGAVAYLARSCQFQDKVGACPQKFWTTHRFSSGQVSTMSSAVGALKKKAGASELVLVGFSGGGVHATLLAQHRDDVVRLITLAAPLALSEWTRKLNLSSFHNTDDPMIGPRLRMPSTHYTGGRDRTVPPEVVEIFVRKQGGEFVLIKDFDHNCCWGKLPLGSLLGDGS